MYVISGSLPGVKTSVARINLLLWLTNYDIGARMISLIIPITNAGGLLILFLRPLPTRDRLLARARQRQLAARRVPVDHRAGANGSAFAYRHRRYQGSV